MEDKKCFEDVLNEIESIVQKLSSDDIKLEESVSLYKKGRELLKEAKDILLKNEEIITEVMNENIKK